MTAHSATVLPSMPAPSREAFAHDPAHHLPMDQWLPQNPFTTPARLRAWMVGLAAIGLAVAIAGMALAPARTLANWLMCAVLFTGIGLFGMVIISINAVTGAAWHTTMRRPLEAMTAFLLPGMIAMLALVPFMGQLYPWASGHDPGGHEGHLLHHKAPWLNVPFFAVRIVLLFGIWMAFRHFMLRASRAMDTPGPGAESARRRMAGIGAAFLVTFAITFSVAAFDWLMSLEPTWFSTIFAAMHFAGAFLGGLAMAILLLALLHRLGHLRKIVNRNHYHTLAQWTFAMSCFWAYLWFCQMMLIWYSNIPEETQHYLLRSSGGWWALTFVINPALNFALPFLFLLPRPAKRNRGLLVRVALVILVGRWVDMAVAALVVVSPSGLGGSVGAGWIEAGILAGFAGVFVLVVLRALGKSPLVAAGDPLLEEGAHMTV